MHTHQHHIGGLHGFLLGRLDSRDALNEWRWEYAAAESERERCGVANACVQRVTSQNTTPARAAHVGRAGMNAHCT